MAQTQITTVTLVSMEWIKANVTMSVDGYSKCSECGHYNPRQCGHDSSMIDWDYMTEMKLGDFYKCEKFATGIKNPICLQWIEELGTWQQGNGHHRVCYAHREGLEFIPAVFSFTNDYMMGHFTGEYG